MKQPLRLYPIGIQTFEKIIKGNYVYVDKTEYVYRMTHFSGKYVFLGRPRRFGKSLLASTLHSYFAGRRELFRGLAIERLETEWTEYPVLHFDMSLGKHMDKEALLQVLIYQLETHERAYGIVSDNPAPNIRLTNLIRTAYEQTGREVVVLIDEYDAPLLDVMHEEQDLPVLRQVMRNFYSPLKACDPYLKFVFLTGITKFSQMSIFSELNNIKNISMDAAYAGICGITQEELLTQMSPDIDRLADALQLSREETIERLRDNYDGYHFAWPSPDIYNPFSLLNAMVDGRCNDYWFGSGTPTYLIEMMKKFGVNASQIGEHKVKAADFDAPTERMTTLAPLLYQSGYVTIKNYSSFSGLYTLDIPNREVRIGLMNSLLPYYVSQPTAVNTLVGEMAEHIYFNRLEDALRLLQTFLATVPYCDNAASEGHFQQVFYIIFSLLGYYADVEVRTPRGRVDMVMRTHHTLYVVELKLDQSAAAAMAQIDLKQYPDRFALCGLPVVKVGLNFSTETRTLEGWEIG